MSQRGKLIDRIYDIRSWTAEETALFRILAQKSVFSDGAAVRITPVDIGENPVLSRFSMREIKGILDELLRKGVQAVDTYDNGGEKTIVDVGLSIAKFSEFRVEKNKDTGNEVQSIAVVFGDYVKGLVSHFSQSPLSLPVGQSLF